MKKIATLLLLLIAFASRAQISPQQSARYQAILDSVCNGLKIKGATASVLVPGLGTWQGASGISEVGVPMDTAMYLGLGSNTKTYIACLMLRLQEQGMLSLEDTIGTWFPNQPNIPGNIKVRQLLNHTSGLYNFTNHPGIFDSVGSDVNRIWQPEEVLPMILPPIAAAGGAYNYCNTNYLLAGMIADQVSGMPVYDALQQYLYGPQGMSHTFMFGFQQPTGTVSHSWTGAPLYDLADIGFTHTSFFTMVYSAGALMSTVGDNVRFWHRWYSGQILSPASMAQMRTYVPIAGNARYGLGVFRYANKFGGRTILRHGGTALGFINENAVDTATGICVSVLTNQDSVGNSVILDNVVGALIREALFPTPASIGYRDPAAGLSIYPNPASGRFYVSNLADGTELFLRDAAGRLIWEGAPTSELAEVRTETLAPGIYLLEATLPDGRQMRSKVQVLH